VLGLESIVLVIVVALLAGFTTSLNGHQPAPSRHARYMSPRRHHVCRPARPQAHRRCLERPTRKRARALVPLTHRCRDRCRASVADLHLSRLAADRRDGPSCRHELATGLRPVSDYQLPRRRTGIIAPNLSRAEIRISAISESWFQVTQRLRVRSDRLMAESSGAHKPLRQETWMLATTWRRGAGQPR
jgi:hypothetical protein